VRIVNVSPKAARWTVPVAALAVTGAAIASGVMPSAGAAPVLPAETPAQLLADVSSTHKIPPLTGTVVETTSLGLPQLPQTGDPTSLSSLLTGSHTVKVYWQDARHFRLSVPQSMSETDVVRNGGTGWLWESNQNTVTKFTASPPDNSKKMGKFKRAASQLPQTAPITPQQAADAVLAKVGKTTVVSTQSNVDVANQAAYQLVLAPKSAESTIGSVRVAVDGKTGVPLRLQVFPKGTTTPAFQVGYTSIDYAAPSSSNFTFTPPPGAKVTTPGANGAKGGPASKSAGSLAGAGTYGKGWLSVAELPASALTSNPGSSITNKASSPVSSSSSSSAGGNGSPLSGNSQEIASALLGSGTKVSGAWGSGQLVHTSLLNVLITGGKLYVGAVSPSVLESAVGHTTAAG